MPTTRASYNDMLAEFRQLAKRADQQLVRMEKAGATNVGSYRSAMSMIKQRHGDSGKPRFNKAPSKDKRVLSGQINEVKSFLDMKTTTATKRRDVYNRTRNTLNERYGLHIESEGQLKAIFDGALWAKLNAKLGSSTAVKVLSTIQKNNGDMKEAFKQLEEQHVFLSSRTRMSIGATVGNYMRANKLDYLFNEVGEKVK